MRRQHSLRQHHRSTTQQIDLFGKPDGVGQRPEWQALPAQTRQALTDLMVRMLRDQAEEACRSQPGEARHDI